MTVTRGGGIAGPVDDAGPTSPRPAPPTSGNALPADPRLARELLDGLAEAVLTTDPAGLVTLINAMAAELLPELTAGTDLSECAVPALAHAVATGADTFDADHGGRRLRGARRPLAGGQAHDDIAMLAVYASE
jgi:hypothetical protein